MKLGLENTGQILANSRSDTLRWVYHFYTERLTRSGRWFLWPTAAFLAYGGMTLQIQGFIPLSYVLGLWIVGMGAMLAFRPRVTAKVQHADRVCAGESLPVDIEIEHVGQAAGELFIVPHRLPAGVSAEPLEGVPIPSLPRGQKCRVRLSLRCARRGSYALGGYRVETDFPVSLLHARRVFAHKRALLVYPPFRPLARLTLPTGKRYHPGGVAMASNLGESFEFIGNREYRDGDNPRDIDWRATARLNRPIVREYREEYFLRVAVILDTHVPKRAKPAAREAFERAVSIAASVADYMARQEYLVDIFAAGPNLYHLTAGRSLAYLDQILDILACVGENPAEPFAVIEPPIMQSLAKITTVICVFLDWNDARRAFAHKLAAGGAGVKVIIARDTPCTVDPIEDIGTLGEIPVVSAEAHRLGTQEL